MSARPQPRRGILPLALAATLFLGSACSSDGSDDAVTTTTANEADAPHDHVG